MNPEIVLRAAHEREQEMRREARALPQAGLADPRPTAPRVRARGRPLVTLAWLLAFVR
jgi:hypothetical protein